MIFIDELQQAFKMMLHPDTATKQKKSVVDALAFYYKYSLIPLIAAIIVSLLVGTYAAHSLSTAAGLSSGMAKLLHLIGVGGSIAGIAVLIWVLEPIGFFVNSAIIQFFGKFVFKEFKKGYENTFTALTLASIPVVLTLWLAAIPLIGFGVSILFGIWGFVMLIIVLANQQNDSRLKTLVVVIASDVIAAIAIAAAAAILAGALVGSVL